MPYIGTTSTGFPVTMLTVDPSDDDPIETPEMFDLVWPTDIELDNDDDEVDEYGFPIKLGDFYAS